MKKQIIIILIHFTFQLQLFAQYKYYAHRGASSIAPENTIVSFKKAKEVNAYGLELDLRLTVDDSIVVMHDESLERTTNGIGFVSQQTYKYISTLDAGAWFSPQFKGEKIPTIGMVINNFNNYNLILEIKNDNPKLPRLLISYLNNYKITGKIIIASFNSDYLDSIKKISNYQTLYYIQALNEDQINMASAKGYSFIGPNSNISLQLIKYTSSKNIEIIPYTINEKTELNSLKQIGIKNFITDVPQIFLMRIVSRVISNSIEFDSVLFENNYLHAKIKLAYDGIYKVKLINILGEQVYDILKELRSGKNDIKLNLNYLNSGFYIILVENDMDRVIKKIIYIK